MGIFDLFRKNDGHSSAQQKNGGQSSAQQKNDGQSSAQQTGELTQEDIKRLANHAGHIIQMFREMFKTPQGPNLKAMLMYTSGLAGYACHVAVKELYPERFVVVETNNGKKYFYGDALNHFLLEDKYSVYSFCMGAFSMQIAQNESNGVTAPDINEIIALVAQNIGNDAYKIWGELNPADVFRQVKNCYEGIYDNMTAKYCQNVSEQPVLFGIVLQNIMRDAMNLLPADMVLKTAMENACMISKMDDESL